MSHQKIRKTFFRQFIYIFYFTINDTIRFFISIIYTIFNIFIQIYKLFHYKEIGRMNKANNFIETFVLFFMQIIHFYMSINRKN